MIARAFAAFIASLALIVAVHAEDATPAQAGAPRYSFHKVAEGFVRLDSRTGHVALCSRQPVGWACVTAPEDRAALEGEIARMRRNNAILKEDLLSRGLPLPVGAMPGPSGSQSDNGFTLRLPDSQDVHHAVHRVVAFVGQVWHRLLAAIGKANDQFLHKG
ncbi:MAG: hypothetical protein ACRECV_06620 [Xanthobacteraceae bacterium]